MCIFYLNYLKKIKRKYYGEKHLSINKTNRSIISNNKYNYYFLNIKLKNKEYLILVIYKIKREWIPFKTSEFMFNILMNNQNKNYIST